MASTVNLCSTRTLIRASIVLAIFIFLAGCSSLKKAEQPAHQYWIDLENEGVIGQTLTARYRGLSGIELFLQSEETTRGTLNLNLYSNEEVRRLITTASLSLENVSAPAYHRFPFSPLNDSHNQDYYLEIEADSPGRISIGGSAGDTYLEGARYQNGEPQDSQLAFNLVYNPYQAGLGLARLGLTWSGYLAVALILYILPGWGVFALLWPAWRSHHWAEKLALSAGLSLAIYPILFLWTDLAGLHLGPLYAWLPPLAALLLLIWKKAGSHRRKPGGVEDWQENNGPSSIFSSIRSALLPDITLLFVLALVFAVRFWVIRSLDTPLWGDSYQHTMIAQLLVDHGGLFNSWAPYADLHTFTYHFGFHTLVAVFHWVTGATMPQATLWTGQIVNALAVFSLYPLAMRIGRSRWAGVAAVLLAGLLSPMPMFYFNWGRYTQLAGQVILPVAVLLIWHLLENRTGNWRLFALSWLLLGGLALVHYRVLIFALVFIGAYLLLSARPGNWRPLLSSIIKIGAGAAIIFLPWFIRVFTGTILTIFFAQLTTPASQAASFDQQYNAIGNLFSYLPAIAWVLLPLLVGWGLWRRDQGMALIGLWWFLIFLVANPHWFNLPGMGAINNFTVFIAAYIPAAITIGAALGWLREKIAASPYFVVSKVEFNQAILRITHRALPLTLSTGLSILLVLVALWGARQRLTDLHLPQHALVARPDLRAAAWIDRNIPPESRFLVNSFLAYGGASAVGSDAGWWLPLLARRQTTLPPLTYAAEQGPHPNYREEVNSLTAEILDEGVDHPEVIRRLSGQGVTHVYIGQRQGRVNYAGPVLEPLELLASPYFSLVYHQDRVWIFAISKQNR